jgi:hypothetical protein
MMSEPGARPNGSANASGSKRPPSESSRPSGSASASQARRKRPRGEDEPDDKMAKRAKMAALVHEMNEDADRNERENRRLVNRHSPLVGYSSPG